MSQANVDKVVELYGAFGRGDIAAVLGMLTPDTRFEIVGRRSDYPGFGVREGIEGAKEFFQIVGDNISFSEFSPREFHPSGDKVFVLGRYAYVVKHNGRSGATDWCHVFTLRDGKIAEFREFTDTAQEAEAWRGGS